MKLFVIIKHFFFQKLLSTFQVLIITLNGKIQFYGYENASLGMLKIF